MYNIGSHVSGVGKGGLHGVFGSQIWVATLNIWMLFLYISYSDYPIPSTFDLVKR